MQKKQTDFIFIIGRGRSGTTLLRNMLSSHSKICIAPESFFMLSSINKYAKITIWNKVLLKKFYQDIASDQKIKNWDIDNKKLHDTILNHSTNCKFTDLCRIIYRAYANNQHKNDDCLLGDKNPESTLHLGVLLSLFPNAKFIYLTRNPKDNIASFQQVDFDLSSPLTLAWRWCQYNNAILNFRKKHPEMVYTCKYETLCSEPKNEITKILSFLGLPNTETIEVQKISMKSVNKWHNNQVIVSKNKIIDSICYKTAKSLGYELTNPSLSFLEKCAKHLSQYFSQLIQGCEMLLFKLPIKLQRKIYSIYKSSSSAS